MSNYLHMHLQSSANIGNIVVPVKIRPQMQDVLLFEDIEGNEFPVGNPEEEPKCPFTLEHKGTEGEATIMTRLINDNGHGTTIGQSRDYFSRITLKN